MAQITQLDDSILGLLPFQPKAPLIETLSWRSDIVPFYDGTEERNDVRNIPRQGFQTKFTTHIDQTPDIFNTIYGGLVRLVAIPLWAQAQNVGAIADNATVIDIDTTASDYRVDTPVFLTDGCGTWQFAYIDAVAADSLTVDRELDAMRVAFVMPLRVGRIVGTPTQETRGYDSQWSVAYEVDDNLELTPSAPDQYDGDDIYFDENLLPSDNAPVAKQFITERETFDYETGIVEEFTPWTNNRVSQPYRVVKTNQAEAWELREFLYRRAGKFRPFWLPSFEADLRVLSTGALTTTLLISLDSYKPWAENRLNIAVKKTDGTWLARRITNSVVSSPGVVTLTLDSSLAINASQIEFVSWLGLKRLDTDTVQLEYIGNNHCVSSFTLVEIEP